ALHDQLVAAAVVAGGADGDVIAAAEPEAEGVAEAVWDRRRLELDDARPVDVGIGVDREPLVAGAGAGAFDEVLVAAALAPVLPVEVELDVAGEPAGGVEELVAGADLRVAGHREITARLERVHG